MQLNNLFFYSAMLLMLGGCDTMSSVTDLWSGDDDVTLIKQDDSRIDIMSDTASLNMSDDALNGLSRSSITTPQTWTQEGGIPSQYRGHINGSLLKDIVEETRVGDGNDWIPAALPSSPIVSATHVYAMDGKGIITAHERGDIDDVTWRSAALKTVQPVLIGGLALGEDALFAVHGNGTLVALSPTTGKTLWRRNVGTPIRSSLRYDSGQLFVTTVDSQLLCYDASTGAILWQHRGIGESTNLFGTSLPAIFDTHIIVAYQSGEIFKLSRYDGAIIWADALMRPRRTMAIGSFTGIDANPLATDALVISALSSGLLTAGDARNGLRIWEQPIGTRHTPWLDGDHLYIITEDSKLSALSAIDGRIGWQRALKRTDKDITLRYFGPFLLNDTLIALDSEGTIHQFTPTGDAIRSEELTDSLAASPSFAGADAFLLGRDATLYHVK